MFEFFKSLFKSKIVGKEEFQNRKLCKTEEQYNNNGKGTCKGAVSGASMFSSHTHSEDFLLGGTGCFQQLLNL